MNLPAPNLDDRRFQQLVDDAKRLVQQRCPEWTDHNVSDPGVTLIESVATMVDQLFYRLNRVPDRLYVKFLELIGVQLFPPTAARARVTFWLSAPQPETVDVPMGAEIATVRSEADEAISFTTVRKLPIVPCAVSHLGSQLLDEPPIFHPETVRGDAGFPCFSPLPRPGDALLIGLSNAVPSCVVALRFVGKNIKGHGIDPENPPITWKAWTGAAWTECEVDHNDTAGFNQNGDVVLHLPDGHTTSVINRQLAGWLRCEVNDATPAYSTSPTMDRLTTFTIGGTVEAVNAETIRDEVVAVVRNGDRHGFVLQHRPVIPDDTPLVLECHTETGVQEWTTVDHFADSGEDDRHFLIDRTNGLLRFGPEVRLADGTLRRHGVAPPDGAELRMRSYMTGGGARGNVTQGAIRVLKTSIPYITRVENRRPARGGVDGESIDDAKVRGPMVLNSRSRAVTARDYEQLALEAATEIARVRCVPAEEGPDAGVVRVLVVPEVTGDELGRLPFEHLQPEDATLRRIRDRLDERRIVGARLVVEPPLYQGIIVVADLVARPRAEPGMLQRDALEALYRYFHPILGGPDGTGWPFGRPINAGEIYAVLQRLPGIELVETARLFAIDPRNRMPNQEEAQRLPIPPHALVYSYEHQVRVRRR
jgi:predicted phage baseplate assembly protein